MKQLCLPLLFLCSLTLVDGQKFNINDFQLTGEALRTGSDCIRLTADRAWSSGAIWHKKPISLRAPFETTIKFMIGCKDNSGADGMVFVFHPHKSSTGFEGEGMGFAGLNPSLGIEIDTWQNWHLGDPEEDHLTLLANGNIKHENNLIAPIKLRNLEDCSRHILNIKWVPKTNLLTISIDGRMLIRYQKNIRHKIFDGIDEIYWGITAATGDYSNRQEICFDELNYTLTENITPLNLDKAKRNELIGGKPVTLDNLQFESGSTRLLPPARVELDELAILIQKHPDKRLDIVGHTDASGNAERNLDLSQRRAKTVANYLISKGVAPHLLSPKGYGEEYPIANNNSPNGRAKNRRVEFRLVPYYP